MFQFTCPSRSTTYPLIYFGGSNPRFNSRAPRGARRNLHNLIVIDVRFQFTCPSRSTTNQYSISMTHYEVSIHVPLAEHDGSRRQGLLRRCSFNSRAPRGARLPPASASLPPCMFQFTCPSRSTTRSMSMCESPRKVSIHVPLAEHDSARPASRGRWCGFQFTCPSRSTTRVTCG